MKKSIILCIITAVSSLQSTDCMSDAFDDMESYSEQMYMQMEQVFMQISESGQTTKGDTPSCTLSFQEKEDALAIVLSLPVKVALADVSVELEDGVLNVLVRSGDDRVELKISGNSATLSSSTTVRSKGFSGSSHSAQMIPLPTKIDLQRRAPEADLTDGILTITVAKKTAQKIPVTTVALPPQVPQQLPVHVEKEMIDFEK